VSVIGDVLKAGSGIFSAKKPETRAKNVVRAVASVGRIAGLPTLEAQDVLVRMITSGSKKTSKFKFRKNLKIRKINRKIRRMN
jgi:pyridoxal biosynthesis lyase PdxS